MKIQYTHAKENYKIFIMRKNKSIFSSDNETIDVVIMKKWREKRKGGCHEKTILS